MTDSHDPDGPPPPPTALAWGPIGKSLFGGAILASVATVSLTQTNVTYVDDVNALSTAVVGATNTAIALGGYTTPGDGGGGVLLPQTTLVTTCTPDGGQVFAVGSPPHCFVRANPTNSVREWGAICDVTTVDGATWDATAGTLSIPQKKLSVPPQLAPQPGELIAISQIGVQTLWGTSTPAVSMTRFSALSNPGTHYSPGDLVSFAGGTFSQQAAIIVDAVDANGAITQWHFLWGGLYDASAATSLPSMSQDNAHTYCGTVAPGTSVACGTTTAFGATMAPAWSGWSLLNNQTVAQAGTNYAVGDIVTLTMTGGSPVLSHYATLVVEGTNTTGGVSAYDWIDYGAFDITTSSIGSIMATGSTRMGTLGPGAGLIFSAGNVTRAPFSTTISTAGSLTHGTYSVTLGETVPLLTSGTVNIQSLYYGSDDGDTINKAVAAAPKGGLVIPAGCGTTKTINLSLPATATNLNAAQNVNASLNGANFVSSGLYAFAVPSSQRSATPVLANVIYSGLLNNPTSTSAGLVASSGGGLNNMFVEGLGIPEGYGFYGLFEGATAPANYVGPPHGTITNNIPTSGNLVEIAAGTLMRIDKVYLEGGGVGPGNATLQCGLDESDPTSAIAGAVATISLTDSRLDPGTGLFGPGDPDFVLRQDTGCQGSVYDADAIFGGTKADILVYGGSLFNRIHLNSGAANGNGSIPSIPWPKPDTFDLAGVADYGFYVINNSAISETQCDIANRACVFTISSPLGGFSSPGQITDTQIKCGSLTNTPPGYSAVELSDGTANTTVTGAAPSNQCGILPFQLVKLDGQLDPSTSLCNNSYAAVAGCTGYQGTLQSGQVHTQPAVTYTSNGTVTSTGLFAVPFVSPAAGMTVQKLGVDVIGTPTLTHCLLGIYNSAAQLPTNLVAIGTVTSTGSIATAMAITPSITGAGVVKASLPAPGAELAPGTLYFFAVACDNTGTLTGVVQPDGLSGPLVGAGQLTDTASGIVATSWTYPTSGTIALPSPFDSFGTIAQISGQWVPNVYAEP
jgi:hypothetical protein